MWSSTASFSKSCTKDTSAESRLSAKVKGDAMESVKTQLIIGDKVVDVEVFDDKILYLDADGKYEQRLDLLEDLKK